MTRLTIIREVPEPAPDPGEPYPVPDPGEPYPAPDPRRKLRLRQALMSDFHPGSIRMSTGESTPPRAA